MGQLQFYRRTDGLSIPIVADQRPFYSIISDSTQVVLYGSYAKGTAKPDSDIDIAVIVDKLQGDYLDEQAKLYKLRRLVDLRIEPVLIEYGHDRSGFLKEIMDTGQVLYPTAVQE